MLIATTALLVAIGFIAWLSGEYFQYLGLTIIGGTTLIAAGAAIVMTDLEYRGGVSREFAYQTIDNSTVLDTSTADQQLRRTKIGAAFGATAIASLGVGGLLMFLGAAMLAHPLSEGY